MKYKGMTLRNEYKYYIPTADYLAMRRRVAAVLAPDSHMPDPDGYHVRSLYFDDPVLSARFEKVSGYRNRTKHRLRIYNKDPSRMRLEKKVKLSGYIGKRSCNITTQQVDAILSKKTGLLLRSNEELLHEFYAVHKLKLLRPTVVVDYTREAYVQKVGNIRITFDKNLQAGSGIYDARLSDECITMHYAYPPGLVAMEVKFDDFLPTIIKKLIRPYTARRVALSKYVLALNCARIGEKYGLGGIFTTVRDDNVNNDGTAPAGDNITVNAGGDIHLFHL